ncbi:hypothetical protein HY090_02805 [Candidatus Kaiserbacteria bacterium]|nr:hypothetical protein [Candidatus Kaiserbacteria bacterium]
MKKFLALSLIASFTSALPLVTVASIGPGTYTNPTLANTAVPNTGVDVTIPQNIQDSTNAQINQIGQQTLTDQGNAIQQSAFSSDVNASAGCGSSGMGGSLSNTSSQFLGGFLNKLGLSSKSGNLNIGGTANFNIGGLVSSLTHNSIVGQAITAIMSGNASGFVQNIAGGLLSGTGIAGGALSSIAGGALSSVAAGALGIIGGGLGGRILVSVDTSVIQDTHGTRQDQDQQLKVTCTIKPAIATAANKWTADDTKAKLEHAASGNGGLPTSELGYPQEIQTIQDSEIKNFVDKTIAQVVKDNTLVSAAQNYVTQQYANDTDLQKQLYCPLPPGKGQACWDHYAQCGQTSADRLINRYLVNEYCGCRQACTNEVLLAAGYKTADNRNAEQARLEQQGGGEFGNAECTDPAGETVFQKCHAWKQTLTPGAAQNIVNNAINTPAEKQAHASEIGQPENAFLSQLAQIAFTTIAGLLGTAQKSSGGNGSLLDQAANTATQTSVTQATASLQADIETSMGIEATYESVLNDMITNLENTKTVFTSVQSCYAKLTVSTIGTTTPQAIANDASSTISAIIQPQIDQDNALLTASEAGLTQLNSLDNQVQSAQTATDINTVNSAYQALVSSGAIHNSSDLTFLQADHDGSKATLDAMIATANISLAVCRSQ